MDVLVADDYGEAATLVAMLATDDKLRLTPEEQSRGFQLGFVLDLPDERLAQATGRAATDVAKARRVWRSAGEAAGQATLDQMIAAAEFEGEDRAAVLEAGPGRWEAKAESIRRRIDEERRLAPLAEELGRLGIEVVGERPAEGFRSRGYYDSAEAIAGLAGAEDISGAVAVRSDYAPAYTLFLPRAEDDGPEETEEERAEREARGRRSAALQALRDALTRHVAESGAGAGLAAYVGRRRAVGYDWQRDDLRKKLVGLGVADERADAAVASPASDYEVLRFISLHVHLDWWRFVLDVLPLAAEGGFQPSEEDGWLRELALEARSEWEREQADEADEAGGGA